MTAATLDDLDTLYPGLRPAGLGEFVGQERVRERLQIAIDATRIQRRPALDHVLLSGPPGTGKTTIAQIVSGAMGTRMVKTSGPSLAKPADLVGVLKSLQAGDVLFVDEVHRVPVTVREALYPAMEDGHVDLPLDSGPNSKAVSIPLQPFTFVGATTHKGMLAGPFADRFGLDYTLQLYSPDELARIVMRSAKVFGGAVDSYPALLIGSRSRGTPRIANKLMKRALDFALVRGRTNNVTEALADAALRLEGIDCAGLDDQDRAYLAVLRSREKPLGAGTIAASMQVPKQTVLEGIEPFLLQDGFINVTPSGRELTPKGRAHVG